MTDRLIIDAGELIEICDDISNLVFEKTCEFLDRLLFWMLVGMSVGMLAKILI